MITAYSSNVIKVKLKKACKSTKNISFSRHESEVLKAESTTAAKFKEWQQCNQDRNTTATEWSLTTHAQIEYFVQIIRASNTNLNEDYNLYTSLNWRLRYQQTFVWQFVFV